MKKFRLVAIALILVLTVAMFAGCVKQADVDALQAQLDATKTELSNTKSQLDSTKTELNSAKTELSDTKSQLDAFLNPEPFTSASNMDPEQDSYNAQAIVDDELMAEVGQDQGFFLINTANPDGTVNCAGYPFGVYKDAETGKYYIFLMNGTKQTFLNITSGREGVAIFVDDVTELTTENCAGRSRPKYICRGARLYFQYNAEDTAAFGRLTAAMLEAKPAYASYAENFLWVEITSMRAFG